jgi:asparagine synthase (glutamine-hydrolysing)
MCGLAGYIGTMPPDNSRVALALAGMAHRGPDGTGEFREELPDGRSVVILHTRLSILDTTELAAQPFHFGDTVLSFNGEIFNYRELRDDLCAEGAKFRSDGDTEVLSQLLVREKIDALDRCEGMWAFAFYSRSDRTLILSRDRFGEKPLYLFRTLEGLYFASEIKTLGALAGRKFSLNLEQLRRYLVNGYKSLYKSSATFFQDVEELSPGHCLTVEGDGVIKSRCYWRPNFERQDNSISFLEAVEGTREALSRSVELRLRSDVPLAFCLSGGVDSNALVGIAKNILGADVHGFTILNTDERYEEADLVDHAVREFGIRHTVVPIERKHFLDKLRQLIRIHDAPVYTITYFAHWLLMQAIADEGYKVVLSGTGADELFSGYYDHHNAYLSVMRDTDCYSVALENWERYVRPIVRNPFLKDPDYYTDDQRRREHVYLDAPTFSKNLTTSFCESFHEADYSKDLLRNRMANELMHESVPVILHEDDLNSMSVSIENRSPYLDRSLFDWCQKIPTRHLVRDGRAKAVLRAAVKGLAPNRVIENPRKVGFNAPIFDFLDVNDRSVREAILDDGKIFEIVKRDAIEELVSKPELANSRSKFLFNFVNAKLFLEEFAY